MFMGSTINVGNQSKIGEISYNNFGSKMEIIVYRNYTDIDVYFEEYNWVFKNARYGNFHKGTIMCPYEKRYYQIGFLGEGEYNPIIHKKIYDEWRHILRRCCSQDFKNKYPTYEKCDIYKEWLCFQNFAKWYEENYYEIKGQKMELDKDILIKENKIYSPSTCIFVPHRINVLFIKKDKNRGKYPIGVTWREDKNKFTCRCSDGFGKYKFLGYHTSIEDAFACYKQFKENVIKQVADEYKDKIPQKLYEAMYKYEVEIND